MFIGKQQQKYKVKIVAFRVFAYHPSREKLCNDKINESSAKKIMHNDIKA